MLKNFLSSLMLLFIVAGSVFLIKNIKSHDSGDIIHKS